MLNKINDQNFRLHYTPTDNPLENFYIPALSASIQYDRSAGYFSSSALAVAAAGVARLIQNGGRMRLLVGADLSEQDVDAIRHGHELQSRLSQRLLERFPDPLDALLAERLSVLAWMVAEGTLEIKVVLPTSDDGLPIPASLSRDYFHPKSGVFTDAHDNRVAFSGSINESESGWKHNYENFSVYTSWGEGKNYIPTIQEPFNNLWDGNHPGWIAMPVPKAVEERLLRYRPDFAPLRDPLEKPLATRHLKDEPTSYLAGSPQAERILFQFLRDAPYLPKATGLAAATAAISPWPHQSRVASQILSRYPESALLCDEVGLGKTIEIGLVLRQLILSGWVKRVLILVPKSVLRQWQEELYEKFNLMIPRYDGGKFLDVDDLPYQCANSSEEDGSLNPWDACDFLLAGSQLAKRSDRRSQILDANPWDLVIVDEAHHARRKDFKERIYRPNQLLGLLNDLKAQHKVGSLMLMTATPMQVHPLEVWDLLTLIGLGGRWAADEDNFLDFFQEMRKSFKDADWEFVFEMIQDFLLSGGQEDLQFKNQVFADLGYVQGANIWELPQKPGLRQAILRRLPEKTQAYVKEMARRHTPISQNIYRNTRQLLREYEKRGILKAQVPERKPHIKRVQMRQEELALYNRVDEYITHFYQKYEQEKRGTGFIMTVYRRRLTSSFYAVRCSLERRLAYLLGQIAPQSQFEDEDIEQDELEMDISDEFPEPGQLKGFQVELEYLQDFIQKLKLFSFTDSKMEVLKQEINQFFRMRDKLLIFTQYTDTLDYLRSQLVEVYGSQIACYSGRGGEIWNGLAWVNTTKEDVKNRFKQGEIKILIGTESASEGLNLQTCGVLINYDMPWNPMRVEQRIGRIDRIGQEHKEVWISNYFYQDTIEDLIYQRLADRIDWFEVVVGELQPILAEIGETTRRLAMLPPSEREAQLESEITTLKQRLDQKSIEALNLDDYLEKIEPQPSAAVPISMQNIEYLFTKSQTSAHLFRQHPDIPDAYLLSLKGEQLPVTFSPQVFDEHPDTVRFLSYGNNLLSELLVSVPEPENLETGRLLRGQTFGEFDLRNWFAISSDQSLTEIADFDELKTYLEQETDSVNGSTGLETAATDRLQAEYNCLLNQRNGVLKFRQHAERLTLRAKALILLRKAAMVEIALGQMPDLFETETYPSSFSENSISSLARHRAPWSSLLQLAQPAGIKPDENDPFFQQILHDKRNTLKSRFTELTQQARILAALMVSVQKLLKQESEPSPPVTNIKFLK